MRRLTAIFSVVGIGAIALYFLVTGDSSPSLVHHHNGERWYRIEQNGQHIGYMHNRVYDQTLTTHINYRPPDAPAVTIRQRLKFAAAAPFALQTAAYSQRVGKQYSAVSLLSRADNTEFADYQATILRNSSANRATFQGQLKLSDMYSVERWLSSEPAPGSTLSAPYPDFEQLRVNHRQHQLLARDPQGYDLIGADADATTQTRLNKDFVATKLTMAGRYDVILSDSKNATPKASAATRRPVAKKILLSQALTQRQRLQQLELQVLGDTTLPSTLITTLGELSAGSVYAEPRSYIGEHIDYPISHPKIKTLLARFALSGNNLSTAQELVEFTNRQLSYVENQYAGTVLTALEQRRGECTDFADLYTTLARRLGLPARTVYGLAYDAQDAPGFRFHAWNEVYVEDRWHSVDPTWNQVVADATHIPLTDSQYADVSRQRAGRPLEFRLLKARYLDDPTP